MYTGKKHKALHGLLIGDLCLMIAATNSRTAVSIAAFELLLLAISIVFARTAEYARKMIAILCICLCGFRLHKAEGIEPNAKEVKDEIYKFN